MSQRIVSIGECMVELAPSGQQDHYALGFAGDTFNTAWYARKLLPAAWSVDYVTAVGSDAISRRMTGFLEECGIGTTHIERRSDSTIGLYMIELKDGERSFSYWRSDSAARRICQSPERLEAALDGAEIAYFSGITIAILSPEDRETLLSQLRAARDKGTRIVFDTNLRPKLWEDEATMCRAVMDAARVSDIVLPSHDDEATYFGDADPHATLERYRDAGPTTIVVKNGPGEMVSLADGQVTSHVVEPSQSVVDTTAAGDSFNAGFLSASLRGADHTSALIAGAEVAAFVIGHRGALVELDAATFVS
ncbi:sugar kinase [Amaricoccus macauensis]|uniref:sugar kinase n=1 Tax=Amaricoccus macauensis TaxID=57001 RepID=UPI003C7B0462